MKKLSAALLLYLGLASAALAQSVSWPPPAGTVAFLCVYNTSPPTLSTTNVGFVQCDSSGRILTVSSGGGGGAVTIADGADVAEGATTDTASTAGGIGTLSAKLRLMTTQLGTINTTLGSPFQAGGSIGNTTFASTQSGTWNINNISGTVSLPTGAATSANQTTMATNQTVIQAPIAPATATATKSELIGCQYNTPAVTFTNAQQGSIACGPNGEFLISGTVASGATDVGNPVKVGGRNNTTLPTLTDGQRGDAQLGTRGSLNTTLYVANSTNPVGMTVTAGNVTAGGNLAIGMLAQLDDTSPNTVTENNLTNLRIAPNRALVMKPYSTTAGGDWTYAAAASGISNTTTAVTIKTAGGGTDRNCVTAIDLNSTALGAATEFAIRDGAGGTVLWRITISTAGLISGLSKTFPTPICGTAATLLEVVTLTASITGNLYVNAQGYAAP